MKILFAFENPLPSFEADAEVFVTTAKYLASLTTQSWLHVPLPDKRNCETASADVGMPVIRAFAPIRPAVLRHFFCGLTLVFRREFKQADLVYTRNLWVAWLAVLFRQRVAFDHYRPWPDQIPPLQRWLYRLICNRRFLVNICHSQYTRKIYAGLGVPPEKLCCVRNGFEPQRLQQPMSIEQAKQAINVDPLIKTVVYTGRVNHKKGLNMVVEAAKQLPDVQFILVGSGGEGPIEKLARGVANLRIVAWKPPEALAAYIYAADCLLIPPSSQPLAQYGSTVLPLKLFFYMAAGRPIIAGDTPDVREMLRHGENAFLCRPDQTDTLIAGIDTLIHDEALRQRLAETALVDSGSFTWSVRAQTIAAILVQKLQDGSSVPGAQSEAWNTQQRRKWRRQSWRWLLHLVRTRSWVLPPSSTAMALQDSSAQQATPPHT